MKLFYAVLAAGMTLGLHAALDFIDADGVTETGGTSQQARMLPRTGADGRISASLLPPVETYGAQRVPGITYIAGGATAGGNGSPLRPFRGLNDALREVGTTGAFVFAPAQYDGTVFDMSGGCVMTLIGCGYGTYFPTMNVTVRGDSAVTELGIGACRIGTLTVSGGRVILRMSGAAYVDYIGGNADITVVRTDMGSKIGVNDSRGTTTDMYTGYPTAPAAYTVVSRDGNDVMSLAEGKATVGPETVAYESYVDAATGTVYGTISVLQAEDERLSAALSAEEGARIHGDSVLAERIVAGASELSNAISVVSRDWNGRVDGLNDNIVILGGMVTNVVAQEHSDYITLLAAIEAVRTGYAQADSRLRTELLSTMTTKSQELQSRITSLQESTTAAISSLRNSVNQQYTVLSNRVSVLEAQVSALNTWKNTINTWKTVTDNYDNRLRITINQIITVLDDARFPNLPIPVPEK